MLGVTVQPDGQPIPDLIPRWQNISRPAAVIEDIRKQVALDPPRILILQQNVSDNAKLHALRRVLQIGGMSAVHLTLPLDQPDAVAEARPAIVILLDLDISALDPAVQAQFDHSLLAGGLFTADTILASDSQIVWLITLANMTKVAN